MTSSKKPLSKNWQTANGVFSVSGNIFSFTDQERKALTEHLKSIRDQTRIEEFLIGAQGGIAEWLTSYPQSPTKSKKGDVKNLDKLHDRLKDVISTINSLGSVSDYFWLKVTERLKCRGENFGGAVEQREWREAERRAVFELDDLACLAAQLRKELADTKGLVGEYKLALVKALISSYLIAIKRTPSSTQNGIFMNVMGEVTNILATRTIDITIGEKIVKAALNEMRSTIETFEKYR